MMRNGMLAMALAAGLACAEPITYQGHLLVDGLPAEGSFDLEYRVFDSVMEGVQLGQTAIADDVVVSGGLLDVELDLGDAFDSADAYLEISVRLGDSEDSFDILAPRQLITATPKAVHASKADAMTGLGWSEGGAVFGDGQILKFGSGDDRVLINRSTLITPIEYFGVHITNLPIGGIVISNEEATGSTILAHAVGGSIGASQTFDGPNQRWYLTVGVDEVFAADATGIQAASIGYTSPVTQAVTVAGDMFHSALGTPFAASFFSGGAYLKTAGDNAPMVAPIMLPHGAVITRFTARFEDNAVSELSISLVGAASDGSLVTIASVASSGAMSGIQTVEAETIAVENVIDSFGTGYYLRAFCNSWPGDESMRVWSVTVEYTVTAPN